MAVFIGALALVAGCEDDDNTTNTGAAGADAGTVGTGVPNGGDAGGFTPTGMPSPDAGTAMPTTGIGDPDIAAIMQDANQAEVQAGELAVARAQSESVRAFGQMMVTEHSMANQRLMMLIQRLGITPADSALRTTQATAAQAALELLLTRMGASFDMAYVITQVDMHRRLLTWLDDLLIPAAQNAELKAEITAARGSVAMHLAAAEAMQAGATGMTGTGSPDGGAPAAGAP